MCIVLPRAAGPSLHPFRRGNLRATLAHTTTKRNDWNACFQAGQLKQIFHCSVRGELNGGGQDYINCDRQPVTMEALSHLNPCCPRTHSFPSRFPLLSSPHGSLTDAEAFGSRQRDAESAWECVVVCERENACPRSLCALESCLLLFFISVLHLEPCTLLRRVFRASSSTHPT